MDDTLEKMGTITDYYKLYMKTILFILGHCIIIILLDYQEVQSFQTNEQNMPIITAIFIPLIRNYCIFINVIDDLTVANILELVHTFKYKSIYLYLPIYIIIH